MHVPYPTLLLLVLSSACFSLSPKPDLALPVVILSLSSYLFQAKHLSLICC